MKEKNRSPADREPEKKGFIRSSGEFLGCTAIASAVGAAVVAIVLSTHGKKLPKETIQKPVAKTVPPSGSDRDAPTLSENLDDLGLKHVQKKNAQEADDLRWRNFLEDTLKAHGHEKERLQGMSLLELEALVKKYRDPNPDVEDVELRTKITREIPDS